MALFAPLGGRDTDWHDPCALLKQVWTGTRPAGNTELNVMNRSWMHLADASGETPLSRALKCGFTELAEFVLREMHHEGRERAPRPVPREAYWGMSQAGMELLSGATWNGCSRRTDTELHKAIRDGHRETVEAMLAFGADANETTASGMTPLHWCALTGDAELAEVLVAHGAQTNARAPGLGGLTPKAAAKLMGYEELADLLSACGGTC